MCRKCNHLQRAVHLWIGCLVGRLCKEGKVVPQERFPGVGPTPEVTTVDDDVAPLTTTCWVLPVRIVSIHVAIDPVIP